MKLGIFGIALIGWMSATVSQAQSFGLCERMAELQVSVKFVDQIRSKGEMSCRVAHSSYGDDYQICESDVQLNNGKASHAIVTMSEQCSEIYSASLVDTN